MKYILLSVLIIIPLAVQSSDHTSSFGEGEGKEFREKEGKRIEEEMALRLELTTAAINQYRRSQGLPIKGETQN